MTLLNNFKTKLAASVFAGGSALALTASPAQNRYGAEQDLGYEVYNVKRDLKATSDRVARLESEVASLRGKISDDGGHVSYRTNNPAPPVSSRSGDGFYHAVQSGDTLSSIGRRFGVGVDRLVSENRITNPNALRIGQQIFIPGKKGSQATGAPPPSGQRPPAASGTVHTVAQGETLYRIARTYGVTPADISAANGMSNPNALRIGQRLTIPGGPTGAAPAPRRESAPPPAASSPEPEKRGEEVVAPEGFGFYQVEPGDTLHSIAISFGTNTTELKRLNDLRDSSLHVGDFLLVPVPDDSLYES